MRSTASSIPMGGRGLWFSLADGWSVSSTSAWMTNVLEEVLCRRSLCVLVTRVSSWPRPNLVLRYSKEPQQSREPWEIMAILSPEVSVHNDVGYSIIQNNNNCILHVYIIKNNDHCIRTCIATSGTSLSVQVHVLKWEHLLYELRITQSVDYK